MKSSSAVLVSADRPLRVFLTGGTGFFGKSILDFVRRDPSTFPAEWTILSRSPCRFRTIHPELADLPSVRLVAGDVRDFRLPDEEFDVIVHAATPVTESVPESELVSIIEEGMRHVISFARDCRCRRFLFTSSGAVYGSQTAVVTENAQCRPETAYGRGKLRAEEMLLDSGLDAVVARCFAFVGPHLDRGASFAIGNFIQDCLDGREIVIRGSGTPLRSYLYADDLVTWLMTIALKGEPGHIYNVGSPDGISIHELAELVRATLGTHNAIRVDSPAIIAEPSVYVPDVSRAVRELGLSAQVGLAEAIRLTAGRSAGNDIR